jgi:hypothetical protein
LLVEFRKRTDYFRRQAVALRLPKIVAAQKKSNKVASEQQRILHVGRLFKRSEQLQLALIDCWLVKEQVAKQSKHPHGKKKVFPTPHPAAASNDKPSPGTTQCR